MDEIPQLEKQFLPELPGILNLVLQAGPGLIERGHFDVPERCQLAKEKYKLELDTSRSFCRECLVFDKRAFIISDKIYSYYRVWCHAHGHTPVNSPNFWRSFHVEMQKPIADGTVVQKRPTLKSGKRPWGWKGLRYAEDGGEPEGIGPTGPGGICLAGNCRGRRAPKGQADASRICNWDSSRRN